MKRREVHLLAIGNAGPAGYSNRLGAYWAKEDHYLVFGFFLSSPLACCVGYFFVHFSAVVHSETLSARLSLIGVFTPAPLQASHV